MEKRVVYAFILSLIVLLTFQYYQSKHMPVRPPAEQSAPVPAASQAAPGMTAAPQTSPEAVAAAPNSAPLPAGKQVVIETDLYRAVIDTRGGRLVSLALKHYTRKKKIPFQSQDETSLETIPQGEHYPFEVSGEEQLLFTPDRESLVLSAAQPTATLILKAVEAGATITKKFTFDNRRYGIDFRFSMTGAAPAGNLSLVGFDETPAISAGRGQAVEQVIVFAGNKPVHFKRGGMKNQQQRIEDADYLSRNDGQYILTLLKPERPLPAVLSGDAAGDITASYELSPAASTEQTFYFYSGPSEYSIVKKENPTVAGLLPTGPMVLLGRFILRILTLFHKAIPNWGVAIILLTVLIKIIFFPLTRLSLRTMKTMQKLQPYLKDLSKKYKDNPQAMQKEMFGIYRQYHINPMFGCLPMLIQIPIFIAIFIMLKSAIALRGAPFFLWINDLSLPDALFTINLTGRAFPINVLPVLMGVTTFFQQKLSSAGTTGMAAEQQRMMTFLMPVMLTVFLYNLPSGLMLYWTTTNLFSILEQEVSTHSLKTL